MSTLCEISDLPIEQCACRVHKVPEPLREAPIITARFDARFDSNCDECEQPIFEGDPIARTGDGYYVCDWCSR